MKKLIIDSNKYYAELDLNERVTLVRERVDLLDFNLTSWLDNIYISITFDDYKISYLDLNFFSTLFPYYIRLGRHKHPELSNLSDEEFLERYWSVQENIPYSKTLVVVDSEKIIRSRQFTTLVSNDKENYYLIISHEKLPDLSHLLDGVYDLVADGRNHYLRKQQ